MQLGAQAAVRGQRVHVRFGEASADEQAVHRRQALVVQRVEGHKLRPGGVQGLQIAWVIEAERGVARDAHAHRRARRRTRGRRAGGHWRSLPGHGEHLIEIDLGGNERRDLVNMLTRRLGLVARDKAQVALDDRQALIVLHGAEHRNAGVMADHGAQLRLVTRTAELIQYHAGDPDVPVEGLIAENQRRDAARHAARVDHQHHRRTDERGERGVAVAAFQVEAVVQALVALDEAERRAVHAPRELGADLLRAAQVEVEVMAGPPGRESEPQRIDVVRPFLERLHDFPARAQGGAQADAHCGLARGLVGRGDDEAIHAATESTSPSARLRGRKGSTLSATAVSASASATPPAPSATSGRLGA